MQHRDLASLLILGAIWGGSFLFMRVAAPEFGVFALVEVRTVLATLVLLPFLLMRGGWQDLRQHWVPIGFIGLINTAIPFVLFNYSSLHLQAGVNAILNATAPMFGALIAWLWLSDKLSLSAVVGLLLGFLGVGLISLANVGGSDAMWLPIASALAATTCYGLAASMMKRFLTGVKPLAVATGSQAIASVLLLPVAIITWPQQLPSELAWWNAIALAVAGTGIAYILYFNLIANIGPSRAIAVAYLVPLFGILWGAVLLGERLSLNTIIGGVMIIFGVALTTGAQTLLRRPKVSQ